MITSLKTKTKTKRKTHNSAAYPKPGPTGGALIRQVIAQLRKSGVKLPLDSRYAHVLIAVSGGADSTALAHLLARYGRKIVANPKKLRFLHVNHGWRAEASDGDEVFVRNLAKSLGAGFSLKSWKKPAHPKLSSPENLSNPTGESLENVARRQRKRFFAQQAQKHEGVVLTAHQADDVAETLIWRILTGQAETHSGGIAVQHGVELRPLLMIRKKDLKQYLKEEGQEWREDSTNQGDRFLRARLRGELMPIMEYVFPRAVEHLGRLAERARERVSNSDQDSKQAGAPYEALFGAAGLMPRRPHWVFLKEAFLQAECNQARLGARPQGRLSLPGGWILMRESTPERWVLQRDKTSET